MHNAASVAAVTSPSRIGVASRVSRTVGLVNSGQSVKALGAVRASAGLPSSQNVPVTTSANGNVPLGLLLSVNRPSGANVQASTAYADLETDLRTGNLAAAQQAYLRLQSDLLLTSPAPAAAASAAAAPGGQLNTVA